jgi:hypothetical protein
LAASCVVCRALDVDWLTSPEPSPSIMLIMMRQEQ